MWKVIASDNYNRESISDEIVCENCSEANAIRIARLLNQETSDKFYRAVPGGYKLYRYNPNGK